MAITEATKEALHLLRLLSEIGFTNQHTVSIGSDNLGAQSLARNPVYHARSKHIDVKHNFIREVLQEGSVEIYYVPTEDMIADVLTKGLSKEKHFKFVKQLGVSNL